MHWEGSQSSGMSLSLGLWDGGGRKATEARTLPPPSLHPASSLGSPRGTAAITEKGLQVDKDKLA